MTYSYIYLLQDGMDRHTNIFKIGMTEQNSDDSRKLTRLQDYSKGTIVFNTYCVPKRHVRQIETDIKMVFSLKYKLCRGTEWFKGDSQTMKKDIDTIIDNYCEHQTRSRYDEAICTKDSDDEYSTMDLNSLEVAEPTKPKPQETKCDETYCEHQTRSRDDEYSTLDLNSLEVAEPTKSKPQETKCDEDYKQKYFALQFEYAKLR